MLLAQSAAQHQVKEVSEKLDIPYVNYRWPGGMLTNLRLSDSQLNDSLILSEMLEKDLTTLKLKERLQLEREIGRLEQSFGGIKKMNTYQMLSLYWT